LVNMSLDDVTSLETLNRYNGGTRPWANPILTL
jgi:hypothetical protein